MISYPILFALSEDQYIGRFSKASIPDQEIMELLIENIINKGKISGYPSEKPRDISEWRGLIFDENKNITEIDWGRDKLKGSLQLGCLPLSVEAVRISSKKLSGSIDLTDLPEKLELVYLNESAFTWEICLTNLPARIKVLDVSRNQLSGGLDLTRLPPEIEELMLETNKFQGIVDFSKLPKSVTLMSVSGNFFLYGNMVLVPGMTFYAVDTQVELLLK